MHMYVLYGWKIPGTNRHYSLMDLMNLMDSVKNHTTHNYWNFTCTAANGKHITLHILGLLVPSVQACVVIKQLWQKVYVLRHDPLRYEILCTLRTILLLQSGFLSNIETTGSVSYQATLVDGRILKRHLDEIHAHYDNTPITNWYYGHSILSIRAPQTVVRQSTKQRNNSDS